MNCYTLSEGSKKILGYVDLSKMPTAHLFDNPSKVKTVAFNTTIPDLNWESVVQSIVKKDDPNIFLYTCVDLVPGNSLSSVVTEDCILVAYSWKEFTTMPDDKSMALCTNNDTVYRLSFHDQTSIKSKKSGKVYINNNGKLIEVSDYTEKKDPTPPGTYGVELSF